MAGKSKKKTSEKKGASAVSVESYRNKIITFLKANGKKTTSIADLETKCRTKKNGRENFTFGFAMTDSGVEYFIPGKCMLGAMPHDRVLIADIASRTGEPEGEVVDILSFGSSVLTGRIELADDELYLVPDIAPRNHMIIVKDSAVSFAAGDKVLAEIVSRGKRHAEHKVRITSVFGSSELAQSCAQSILCIHGERDYRILANQGMAAFDAARMRGIPAELLIFPDENHWVLKPQNGILWQRTFFEWLDRWLK